MKRIGVDRYAVRWYEGGYFHVRYFVSGFEEFLAYVKHYDRNAYVVATR